ncbi:CHAT domain-containing protein [Allosphingosinicella deserti]|uniref:CHAT domain-containing protein n=1 Tax=Allosphingosinicella deserti TaxID=2116704 RepID=A0A2P7QFT1_9SPHN|nr:CHAT domain-containing protein [Sphingomonas deserti]PSJ36842.1 hypothetical protein C7I55_24325 [Sphingomonas deserti]
MTTWKWRHLSLVTGLTALGALTACAGQDRPQTQLDVVNLGRNAANEPCSATRTWNDAGTRDLFDSAYLITCRNVTASRPLGAIRIIADKPEALAAVDALFECGNDIPVQVAGLAARGRRCVDKSLGLETVRVDLPLGRTRLVANATPSLVGAMEQGIAVLAGTRSPGTDPAADPKATIDLALLPPSPTAPPAAAEGFDAAAALRQGIALNHNGRHTEASRVLNDALSRLPENADAGTRAELLLETGLADSNIVFSDSAQQRFAQADALIGKASAERAAFLQRKRNAYVALDLLNRRRFADALVALDRLISVQPTADEPLMDVATIRQLNQASARPGAKAVAVPDTRQLSQLVIDAQANWARSVALLGLGDETRAAAALDAATRAYRSLLGEPIEQTQTLWLGARIERQRGRLAAQRKDWPGAITAFDNALLLLRRSAAGTLGTGTEPSIAEAQLERAGIIAQSGAPAPAIRSVYQTAVEALVASNSTGAVVPSGLENYLDLLVRESERAPRPETYELFFRAVQATGEPAVARQLNQLQNVVSTDPELTELVRSRAALEREITRLRYAIADRAEGTGESIGDLETQRDRAEAKLLSVNAALASSPRFRSVDDSPATIEAIRAALRPGEGYFKLFELPNRLYGVYVSSERTFIYQVVNTRGELAELERLATAVRASIDGRLQDGQLVPYDAGGAHVLFRLIAGPAREAMLHTRSLVVDPGGPLGVVPVGALVASYDPNTVREDPFDFSATDFLARRTTISTALSPRSFLVSRALPASAATQPFLGLGTHLPPPETRGPDRIINVGFGCSVGYNQLASISRAFPPIATHELQVAAEALGQANAPLITAAQFSDTAIEQRADLGSYQVLHFATHGLQEGQWGCSQSPPALVTSFGDTASDGLLSFSEIAQLRLNANLVVLSACDTASGVRSQALARASGQEESGSTLEGLVRAFLAANARSVLATYWQVSAEKESEDLMRSFYTAARTQSIGEALQTAQRSLISQPQYSHPFYWAPYFLVGDSTKPMLSRPARNPVIAAR